ncbi:MAG: GtrA family protein [Sphingobium sp.]|nr:MAG: GtrA family protein [Sphingobium sp.]
MKIVELLQSVPTDTRALAAQIVRYGITGVIITAIQAAVYYMLATRAHAHPQVANLAGYLVAVVAGYALHGRYTFRGHGTRKRPAARGIRFVLVSLLSLALNALWVWLCVTAMRWPAWSPIPLMFFATPALVFVLNRQWVFR